MAPIETNPVTAKKKKGALQACSANANIGKSRPATNSGPPRQPPE